MAYSINERSAFTLGYKHDFIDETETEVNGVDLTAPSLSVGSLLLGYSFQVNDYASTNINLELGVTDDAPDVLMTLRVPFVLDLFQGDPRHSSSVADTGCPPIITLFTSSRMIQATRGSPSGGIRMISPPATT